MAEVKKILVVDDEAEIRELFNSYLTKKGYAVDLAKDGLEAIKKTESEKYDFIFLDIKMSGLDGVETFRRIKEKHNDACFVIMTGYRVMAQEVMTDSMKGEICAILYKPFRMSEVLGLIKKQEAV
ncbi:MAG: response regulator [Candidatus Omnitrophica bacterium]|nr:response regulator [Candidatus Omnitrophota bacterium]